MTAHRLFAPGLCALLAASALLPQRADVRAAEDATKGAAASRKDLLGDLLPEGALARMGSGRLRGTSAVSSVAFTPDGKFLVSGGASNKLEFWSVATGKREKEWTVGASYISSIAYTRDGKTMAIAGNDGTVRILDGGTGVERRQFVDPVQRYGNPMISLSPDGKWVVMNQRWGQQIVIFDAETGVLKHRVSNIRSYNLPQIAFTPDGKHFVSLWTDNKLHLVETATAKSVRTLEPGTTGTTSAYSTRITAMALSNDGKTLVYRMYSERTFHVVDVTTGTQRKSFERGASSYYASSGGMTMTPNGRFVVETAGDTAVRVWGLASGKMLREMAVPGVSLTLMAASPDGKLVASASGTVLYLWDVGTGKQLHGGSGHANAVTKLAFTRNGKYLVSVGSSSMRVWEASTGKELFQTRSNVTGYSTNFLEAEPDNKTIRWVAYDKAVYTWLFESDKDPVRRTTPKNNPQPLNAWAVSPDGKVLVGINQTDRKVKLMDNIGEGAERVLGVLPNAYSNTFTFSPDGRTLAVASSDRSVTLYDVATAMETRKLMPDPSVNRYYGNLLQFSRDSRTLLKYDGEMRVVETISGSDRALLSHEMAGNPNALAVSDDGRLVARGFPDGTVLVHDIWTGNEVLRRATDRGSVSSRAFSHDGKRLATGGSNTTAVVWEVPLPGRPPRVGGLSDEAAWADLEDTNAARAQRAMAHLIGSPEETVRLFKDYLKPRPPVDAARIAALVKELDDDDYKVRERANTGLLEIGMLAEAALKKASRSPSAEVKRRAQDLLRRLKPGTSVAPDRLRAQRAVEVLERIGTGPARGVLENMLKSKLDPALEVAIKGSLDRMAGRG